MTKLLPILMLGQSVVAGILYLMAGDWRHGGYWLAAAAITGFVTF